MKFEKQNGFGLVGIIIALAVVVLAAGGGGLYWKETRNQKSVLQSGNDAIKQAKELKAKIEQQNNAVADESASSKLTGGVKQTMQTQVRMASSTEFVDTSNWKTYRNEKYGFEVKYPSDWAALISTGDRLYDYEEELGEPLYMAYEAGCIPANPFSDFNFSLTVSSKRHEEDAKRFEVDIHEIRKPTDVAYEAEGGYVTPIEGAIKVDMKRLHNAIVSGGPEESWLEAKEKVERTEFFGNLGRHFLLTSVGMCETWVEEYQYVVGERYILSFTFLQKMEDAPWPMEDAALPYDGSIFHEIMSTFRFIK